MSGFISAITHHLPSATLSNATLAREYADWSVEKIAAKTGIDERHIAASGECASDLAQAAAEKLFIEMPASRDSIDYLIFCSQSADYRLPTTACLLQERLGLRDTVGAIDVNQGCSGFVYSLGLADGLIASGQARCVLVLVAETYSQLMHPLDRSNRTIFGDGAAATLVTAERTGIGAELLSFQYGTDGRGAESLIVRNGGARHPLRDGRDVFADGVFLRNDDYLYMDGKAIFDFSLKCIPPFVGRLLEATALRWDDINLFVLHQANRFMLEAIRKRMGVPSERFCVELEGCGNTVSATIPIALQRSIEKGRIPSQSRVALVGFGVGLSLAGALIRFP